MQALEQAIQAMGKGIGQTIVKVDQFLNHRIDTALTMQMGQEIARHYAPAKPDLVMTVESSGIALGLAAAHALGDVPLVFCKKSRASNQEACMLQARVRSYTRGRDVCILCDPRMIPPQARVLLVDDFLAEGQAVAGMMSLVEQAAATTVGVAVAIEKAFQPGGDKLRRLGVPLLSLAVVKEIRDGRILFGTAE